MMGLLVLKSLLLAQVRGSILLILFGLCASGAPLQKEYTLPQPRAQKQWYMPSAGIAGAWAVIACRLEVSAQAEVPSETQPVAAKKP